MQAAVQCHVDSAISKTVNVPEDISFAAFQAVYLEASHLCQTSCRLNRIGTFGGADIRKWLVTDKRTKIG
jgi:ribonucleoside-diphosphate reductase alpha chain